MLADERRMAIFEYIKKNFSATTEELANHFNVSTSTIRRDLENLASKKLIKRTHKGAVINSPHAESSFLVNYNYMREEKKLIAKKAMAFINNDEFIALSGGTTSYMLATELINSELQGLKIITNSINIATLILESKKDFVLIMAGGIPRKGSYECVGEFTLRTIRAFNIDKFFMGVNGISIEGGISFASFDEASVARELMSRSREKYVIADHTKFEVTKPARVAEIAEVDAIITDAIPEETKFSYTQLGARII